jgi:hypothetical protein
MQYKAKNPKPSGVFSRDEVLQTKRDVLRENVFYNTTAFLRCPLCSDRGTRFEGVPQQKNARYHRMDNFFYQVILCDAVGADPQGNLRSSIERQVKDLDLDPDKVLRFLGPADTVEQRVPRVAVFFGGINYNKSYDTVIEKLTATATPVIPAVSSLDDFQQQVPAKLASVNGFRMSSGMEPLASRVLELFRLLRGKRRVFISYRRRESMNASLQLYQTLDARSFDAFLDTHSVAPAVDFQAELWHRMADSDLVILFYTPEVLASNWVHQELTEADSMGITVLQLIWPGVQRDRRTDLFYPQYLADSDFESSVSAEGGSRLTANKLDSLVALIESMRARALRSREVKLVDRICGLAQNEGYMSVIQPGTNHIDLAKSDVRTRISYAIGIPDATNFESVIENGEKCFLYDSSNIRKDWSRHLGWLAREFGHRLTTITPDNTLEFLRKQSGVLS